MKLTKSLAELEAAADELLAKSKAAEDMQDDKKKDDDVNPAEISDDSVTPVGADSAAEDKTDTDENEDVKKSEQPEEDIEKSEDTGTEDEGETEEDEPEDEDATPEDIEKSLKDDFEANSDIKKGMDSSEFLSAIVEVLTKSMGDIQYDLVAGNKNSQKSTDVLAKSLQAALVANQALQAENERLTRRFNKLEKSVTMGFDKVMDALDDISSQPVGMRKSMVSVHDRDFDRSVNGVKTLGGIESLNKSQVLGILNNELYSGNQNVTASDIISYESGAPLRPDLQAIVASKCK